MDNLLHSSESFEQREFLSRVQAAAAQITELLREKNQAYGNAALAPLGVFSQLTPVERLAARLDEKLSRLRTLGLSDQSEDTLDDLIGGLILLKLAREDERRAFESA